jgi:hypothetical protein
VLFASLVVRHVASHIQECEFVQNECVRECVCVCVCVCMCVCVCVLSFQVWVKVTAVTEGKIR